MFERYTETARKSVFYARYEASSSGSPYIEPVHLLVGVLHSDEALRIRLLGLGADIEKIRRQIEKPGAKAGTTVDLPLSPESKLALAFANEEAERQNHRHIGCAHLLLGLARDAKSPAALMLRETGLTLERLRQEAARPSETGPPEPQRQRQVELAALLAKVREGVGTAELPDRSIDLSAAALEERLDPLIGRDAELDRILQILLRRYRNWVALTGEAGVGKTALLAGLAQRLMEGVAHPLLGGRRVLSIDAARLADSRDLFGGSVILCVEGLFDLSPREVFRAVRTLEAQAHRSDGRIIATGTPEGFRRLAEPLAREFELVELWPPSETETIDILAGLKERYEKFHAITIGHDAIGAAVKLSRRFLSFRLLPDRALDLLDDACARARLQEKKEVGAEDVAAALAARRG